MQIMTANEAISKGGFMRFLSMSETVFMQVHVTMVIYCSKEYC